MMPIATVRVAFLGEKACESINYPCESACVGGNRLHADHIFPAQRKIRVSGPARASSRGHIHSVRAHVTCSLVFVFDMGGYNISNC